MSDTQTKKAKYGILFFFPSSLCAKWWKDCFVCSSVWVSLSVGFTPVRGTLITKLQNDGLTWRRPAKTKNNCFWKIKGLKCQRGFSILWRCDFRSACWKRHWDFAKLWIEISAYQGLEGKLVPLCFSHKSRHSSCHCLETWGRGEERADATSESLYAGHLRFQLMHKPSNATK